MKFGHKKTGDSTQRTQRTQRTVTNAMNAMNARKVRSKRSWRSWRNGCSNNYPQFPPLLGRLLLQFNAAEQNILITCCTNKVNIQK